MKVFFDNCTSPVLASTLHGFIEHRGHSAHHVKDLPCGRDADDVEWMALLAEEPDTWMVITGDYRIQRNRPERTAYRQAKLFGFVLAPAYQKTPTHQIASLLLWRWPEMEKLFELVGGAALHELPIGRSGKIKPLPL